MAPVGSGLVSRRVLVIGAAGMIGRKLVERLSREIDPVDLVLHDVVPSGQHLVVSDLSAPGEAEKLIARRPELIFHLAAVVSGAFTSYFKDKPVPSPNDSTPPAVGEPTLAASPESRIVVVGDGEFFVDDKGGNDRDNLLFFQNMVDWLMQDEDLIGIRSREVTDRPLRAVSDPTKRFVKYANMLGSPLLVVVFGIVAWQIRRRRRIVL